MYISMVSPALIKQATAGIGTLMKALPKSLISGVLVASKTTSNDRK
jgi:hypothetical protein